MFLFNRRVIVRVIVLSGWIWFLAALPEVTDAAMSILWWMVLLFSGVLIGLAWVVYSCAYYVAFRALFIRWWWLSVPALGFLAIALATTHRDLAVRVWLCDSTMTEYAEEARRDPESVRGVFGRRIGLFNVSHTSADENQVLFFTASAYLDSAGVAYRPNGLPPEYVHRSEHLYGPWWWFWERF